MSLLRDLRLLLLNNLDCNFSSGHIQFIPTGKIEDTVAHISGYFEISILAMLE